MTLILKLDLDFVKMYPTPKMKPAMSTGSKVIAQTGKHRDRQTNTHTHYKTLLLPHLWEVIN